MKPAVLEPFAHGLAQFLAVQQALRLEVQANGTAQKRAAIDQPQIDDGGLAAAKINA